MFERQKRKANIIIIIMHGVYCEHVYTGVAQCFHLDKHDVCKSLKR